MTKNNRHRHSLAHLGDRLEDVGEGDYRIPSPDTEFALGANGLPEGCDEVVSKQHHW